MRLATRIVRFIYNFILALFVMACFIGWLWLVIMMVFGEN